MRQHVPTVIVLRYVPNVTLPVDRGGVLVNAESEDVRDRDGNEHQDDETG